jgi:hypothetical protein
MLLEMLFIVNFKFQYFHGNWETEWRIFSPSLKEEFSSSLYIFQ